MPVVVAVIRPKSGSTRRVLDAFAEVSPMVHQEHGCELYAAHTDGQLVVMVERWSTQQDLDAHAAGEALKRLHELFDGVVDAPSDVWRLRAVPLGDPRKGAIDGA
jgi:quinol monooxygenase YgiN